MTRVPARRLGRIPAQLARVLLGLLFFPAPFAAGATPARFAVVLVHGYHSGAAVWWRSGFVAQLERFGWRDAGVLVPGMRGVERRAPPRAPMGPHTFIAVDLPSEAPIPVQARLLARALYTLEQTPGRRLILVGHSAGGIVARYLVVRDPALPVIAVITIASPNLGTDAAGLAAWADRLPPLSMAAAMTGLGTLNRSGALFSELAPARPGSFLYRLNRLPHPAILWVSLVHTGGDLRIVAPYSQDLRDVAALGSRARCFRTPAGHELDARDGLLVGAILQRLVLHAPEPPDVPAPAPCPGIAAANFPPD